MDNATAALARMNMILHDCPTAEIWKDNTLSSPHFKGTDGNLKTFDFVVANFPFSSKAWSNGFDPDNDLYGRFAFGIPPKKNGDYAFLLHILACLKSTGKGAVIHPHGVLFRGGAEATIRREIVKRVISRASSDSRQISFTARVSPRASWSSTRKTPMPARASS